jgi:protein-S-isoprenylcysteine O-methyltransferase Ste14
MKPILLFGILSLPIIIVSLGSLKKLKSHGFYRFLSWECMVWLLVNNYKFWFTNFISLPQIISWLTLFLSTYFVVAGIIEIKKKGKASKSRTGNELYAFEKTTELVESGIFGYIRHPLYSSLVFLTLGIYFKNPTIQLLPFALLSSIFLFITARFDEIECRHYFGDKYVMYMKRTKMFIPYIF